MKKVIQWFKRELSIKLDFVTGEMEVGWLWVPWFISIAVRLVADVFHLIVILNLYVIEHIIKH